MSVTLRRSSSAPTKRKILSQTNKYKSPKRSDHEITPYTCSNSLENLGLRSSSTKSHTHSIKQLHEKSANVFTIPSNEYLQDYLLSYSGLPVQCCRVCYLMEDTEQIPGLHWYVERWIPTLGKKQMTWQEARG